VRPVACSLAVLLVTSASACATLRPRHTYDYQDTADAERRGDVEFLQRACRGEVAIDFPQEACGAAQRLTALSTATCETVGDLYDRTPPDTRNVGVYDHGMAVHFATCGLYADLFERFGFHGTAYLRGLEEEDHLPLEDGFVRYATEHRGPRFFPRDRSGAPESVLAVFGWLGKKPDRAHCALLLDAVAGRDNEEDWRNNYASAGWHALDYAYQAKCREAAPAAEAALLSEVTEMRVIGCKVLGEIGDARVAKKLAILAESDDASTVEEQAGTDGTWGKTVYPVRESCAAALGKLRLRAAD